MKKFALLFALLVSVTFMSVAQIDYSDAQMFGSKRPTPDQFVHDFGTITTNVAEHEFWVTNNNKVPITISNVEIPGGFGVVVVNKEIAAESIGKIIVLVYKDYLKQGSFDQKIIITTEYDLLGETKSTKHTYTVKGSL